MQILQKPKAIENIKSTTLSIIKHKNVMWPQQLAFDIANQHVRVILSAIWNSSCELFMCHDENDDDNYDFN